MVEGKVVVLIGTSGELIGGNKREEEEEEDEAEEEEEVLVEEGGEGRGMDGTEVDIRTDSTGTLRSTSITSATNRASLYSFVLTSSEMKGVGRVGVSCLGEGAEAKKIVVENESVADVATGAEEAEVQKPGERAREKDFSGPSLGAPSESINLFSMISFSIGVVAGC